MRKIIFSKEFVFVLFLNAGLYKSVLPFNNVIDFTVLTLILSFFLTIRSLKKKPTISKKTFEMIVLYTVFIITLLISTVYSPKIPDAFSKFIEFAVIGGWSFIAPLFMFSDINSIKKFLKGMVIFGVIIAFETLRVYIPNIGQASQALIFNSDYLAIGRYLGYTSLITTTYLLLSTDSNKRTRFFYALTLASSMIGIVLIGGRGPLITIAAVISIFLISQVQIVSKSLSLRFNRKGLFGLILLASGVFYFFTSDNLLFYNIKLRLFQFNSSGGGTSVLSRTNKYKLAYQMFTDNPLFGKGLASFQHYIRIPNDYPHNIFLELMSETGLFGTIPFIILVIAVIVSFPFSSLKLNNNYYRHISWAIILMLIYSILNANISGELQGNRILFTFLG